VKLHHLYSGTWKQTVVLTLFVCFGKPLYLRIYKQFDEIGAQLVSIGMLNVIWKTCLQTQDIRCLCLTVLCVFNYKNFTLVLEIHPIRTLHIQYIQCCDWIFFLGGGRETNTQKFNDHNVTVVASCRSTKRFNQTKLILSSKIVRMF
jgi:hypothetical protein